MTARVRRALQAYQDDDQGIADLLAAHPVFSKRFRFDGKEWWFFDTAEHRWAPDIWSVQVTRRASGIVRPLFEQAAQLLKRSARTRAKRDQGREGRGKEE